MMECAPASPDECCCMPCLGRSACAVVSACLAPPGCLQIQRQLHDLQLQRRQAEARRALQQQTQPPAAAAQLGAAAAKAAETEEEEQAEVVDLLSSDEEEAAQVRSFGSCACGMMPQPGCITWLRRPPPFRSR